MSTALWQLPATQISAFIKQGKTSALEVTQAVIARLHAVNPAINAVVDYQFDAVIKRAQAIDLALARGEPLGPLAGVPVTVKVNIDQMGFATTNGIKAQHNLIARQNSPVVDNLLRAGAVIIGRTNTPAFSYRWFTSNDLHGETFNPRNKTLTPGGSSGGAASAVAAGIGCIAHGTDIAGSIRYPAYACGVHGLRPSLGRVAAYNASGAERTIGGQLMAVSGPLARTVADLRLGLQAMSGADWRDPWWVPAPLHYAELPRTAAVCFYPDGLATDDKIVKALRCAAQKLQEAGWQVEEVVHIPPLQAACDIQIKLWLADGYADLIRSAEQEGDKGALTALRGQVAKVQECSLSDFTSILSLRNQITRQWQQFLQHYSVLLLPVCGDLPFINHLDLQSDAAYQRVWQAQMPMVGLPVTGLPALTLTTDIDEAVPVGIQIVANRFREDCCLLAAEQIEQRSPALPMPDFAYFDEAV